MNKLIIATTSIFGLLALQGFSARADEALDKLAQDPKQWVMQQGDNANTRYSKLNQINSTNVKKLQVTRAARWWLATPCTFTRRFRIRSTRWT
jgi:glucose dehydrogenase